MNKQTAVNFGHAVNLLATSCFKFYLNSDFVLDMVTCNILVYIKRWVCFKLNKKQTGFNIFNLTYNKRQTIVKIILDWLKLKVYKRIQV